MGCFGRLKVHLIHVPETAMRLLFLLLIPALLLLGTHAQGQTKADDEFARRHFKLGEEYHNRADYEKALEHFTRSHELSKKPALLFNMARCQELLGEHEKAIDLYDRFLKHDPPQADLVRERVANLTRLVEKKKLKADADKLKAEEQAAKAGAQKAPDKAPASTVPEPRPAPPTAPQPKPVATASGSPRPQRIAGWALVGVGAASLITGVALGALAAEKAIELEDLNAGGVTEFARVVDDEDAGRGLQTWQIAALAAGGALAAVGAVLLILDYRKPGAERSAWLTPTVGPGGAAVTAGVRF